MNEVQLPKGFRFEHLRGDHPRKAFRCAQDKVNDWLATKALQQQNKHLSVTKVLVGPNAAIAGYFTLAMGQLDFGNLPAETVKRLPRRALPVAILAWLGVSESCQGLGLGRLLLAQALHDCHVAGKTFAFIAVILDCLDDRAKSFYRQWDFEELPGHPYRLFLSTRRLDAMMQPD